MSIELLTARSRKHIAAWVILLLGIVFVSTAAYEDRQEAGLQVPPAGLKSPEARLLNRWWMEETAAGNVGDWYDNRDRGHSTLRFATAHPQMQQVPYSEDERARRMDWAVQRRLLPFVTLGNSSTSASPRRGGSNPRQYYVSTRGIGFLYAQYRANNLYVYPEHRDHDPGHNQRPGYGDLYPTNTPYLVISQGSSGSDRAFLSALAYTLAAFRPEVKKRLIKDRLLMPTLQYIMRRCYKDVETPEDYLTGKAHPTVFRGARLDRMKMINTAQNMTIDTVPPLIRLEVLEEDFVAAEGGQRSEKLADTPAVVARIHREPAYRKRIVISAKRSFDVSEKALEYRWVVLRGDPQRIEIRLSDGGNVAELVTAYHDRCPIRPGSAMESNRVDIGVFANNGSSYSAPGLVTVFYLDNEIRTYDRNERLLDIYRAAGDTRIGYPTSVASQMLGNKYDIFDWAALFAVFGTHAQDFASQLLRRQFTAEQLTAVAKVAQSFRSDDVAKLRTAGKLSSDQRAEQRKIQDRLAKALTAEDPAIEASVKEVLETALNSIRSDLDLYFRNPEEIDALASANAHNTDTSAFFLAKKKLAAIGLAHGGKLQSTIPGAESLTKYEVYQVEFFNLAIMQHLLFPRFLKRPEVKNYVDPRLAEPSPWHDVYRYDDSGRILGWTRYEDGKPGEYTVKQHH